MSTRKFAMPRRNVALRGMSSTRGTSTTALSRASRSEKTAQHMRAGIHADARWPARFSVSRDEPMFPGLRVAQAKLVVLCVVAAGLSAYAEEATSAEATERSVSVSIGEDLASGPETGRL